MKKILYTTTAFILCGLAQSQAACIATPSCTTLGYTSTTSCTDGLKCPFGNYWNCTHINKITELTNKITEQTNKITELEKIITEIQTNNDNSCKIGRILFSDKTCGDVVPYGKVPIGVVVYDNGKGGGQALALEPFSSYYKWGDDDIDIPSLPNYEGFYHSQAAKELDSCGNTAKIIALGDKNTYPAAWAAHEYKTEGTSAGDWCLPAAGIFKSYSENQQKVNLGMLYAGGEKVSTHVWTSTEAGGYGAWVGNMNGIQTATGGKERTYGVRPVLEF